MVSSSGCNEIRIDGNVKLDFENAKRGTNSRQNAHVVRMVTGILVWIVICIPSNIVAGIFYFKQTEFKPPDQSINSNYSFNQYDGDGKVDSFNSSAISSKVGKIIYMISISK